MNSHIYYYYIADDTDVMETGDTQLSVNLFDPESTTNERLTVNLKQTAFWILKHEEKSNLTRSAVNEVLSDVTDLIKDILVMIGNQVTKVSFPHTIIYNMYCGTLLQSVYVHLLVGVGGL